MSERENNTPPAARGPHRWQRGMPSPNPKGRPKTGTAFAEAVREHVDPVELIRIALAIARGEPRVRDLVYLRQVAEARARGEPPPTIEGVEVVWPSIADSQAALAFLRTSGWQTPTQSIEIGPSSGEQPLDLKRLSPEELDAYERALAKAAGILDVATERAALEPGPAPAQQLEAGPTPADPLGLKL